MMFLIWKMTYNQLLFIPKKPQKFVGVKINLKYLHQIFNVQGVFFYLLNAIYYLLFDCIISDEIISKLIEFKFR